MKTILLKIVTGVGYTIAGFSVILVPLYSLLALKPLSDSYLDYIWYILIVLGSFCYSFTLIYKYMKYDDIKNRLEYIIKLNDEGEDISTTINSSKDLLN